MRRIFLFIIIFAYSIFGQSQVTDSISVKGKLLWDRENISDFPSSLKVIDFNNSSYIKEINVDSLGHFSTYLIQGEYNLLPSKSYHWQGEDIVRIDLKKSQIKLEALKQEPKTNLVLQLHTINKPQLIPEQGVLHNFNTDSSEHIDTFVKAYMDYYQVSGASLAIIKKGEVIFNNNYGVKNSETNEKVTSETLFEAGSITKTVLAFITMRIYEKGLIDLDKPLYQYLNFEDISHDDRYKKITTRLVLSHQTGFPNWARGKFDLKFEPGTKFGYSGETFEYLKRVLEKITNKSISVLIKEEFLVPLDLKDIYFSGSGFSMEILANGHKNERVSNKRDIKSPMMAFSMVTNAKAFAKFAIAIRNRQGLKNETYQQLFKIQKDFSLNNVYQIFKIQSTREDGTHWGLGFRIEDSKFGQTYGHSGSTNPGFIGNYVYFDELDMGYIVLTNSRMGGWLSIPLLSKLLITGKDK